MSQIPNSPRLQHVNVERNAEAEEHQVAQCHACQEEVGGGVHRLVNRYHHKYKHVAWNENFSKL